MVTPHAGGYPWGMTSTAASPPAASPMALSAATPGAPAAPMSARAAPANRLLTAVTAILLAGFGALSIWVVATRGYTGFLELAGRERWALQMLLDLVIALAFAFSWVRRDARARGIAAWPYAVATVLLGSIGILAYCVRRGWPRRADRRG
jgi:hypothetical protein